MQNPLQSLYVQAKVHAKDQANVQAQDQAERLESDFKKVGYNYCERLCLIREGTGARGRQYKTKKGSCWLYVANKLLQIKNQLHQTLIPSGTSLFPMGPFNTYTIRHFLVAFANLGSMLALQAILVDSSSQSTVANYPGYLNRHLVGRHLQANRAIEQCKNTKTKQYLLFREGIQ